MSFFNKLKISNKRGKAILFEVKLGEVKLDEVKQSFFEYKNRLQINNDMELKRT